MGFNMTGVHKIQNNKVGSNKPLDGPFLQTATGCNKTGVKIGSREDCHKKSPRNLQFLWRNGAVGPAQFRQQPDLNITLKLAVETQSRILRPGETNSTTTRITQYCDALGQEGGKHLENRSVG